MTALPVELPWEQGGGELGIYIQVLLVPIWLIHPRDDMLSPTHVHVWLSVRCSNYLRLMLRQIFKPMTLVYKLVLRLRKKS